MIGLIILFSVLILIFALGMIADKDPENRRNFLAAFCMLVIAVVVFLIKFV